jgi:Spy/CpxP family protein refolding chaperone
MERAIRERFETMVWRELGLDEGQREALAAAVQEFREPRRDVSQRQVRLERRLAGTGALLSEDQAREVLAELVAVKRAEVELLAREQERLLEVLTPPQLVRFYTLREQLGRRIRRLRENRPGGGGPPGRSSPAESLPGWPVLFH